MSTDEKVTKKRKRFSYSPASPPPLAEKRARPSWPESPLPKPYTAPDDVNANE